MKNFIPVSLVILVLLASGCAGSSENTREGEPNDFYPVDLTAWESTGEGLFMANASTNEVFSRMIPPGKEQLVIKPLLTGWRGEKLSSQLVLWSSTDHDTVSVYIGSATGDDISGDLVLTPFVVRYVISDVFAGGCGWRDKDTIPASTSPDIIYPSGTFGLEAHRSRPVWLTIDISPDARPGIYELEAIAVSSKDTVSAPFSVKVDARILPPSSDWKFHLDLWQNPFAVARYHELPLWSQEHWDALRPLLELLSSAGQKCITTTLNDSPWGGQTYDPFGSMITWLKDAEGSWSYDYSIFDQYVSLAMDCGISEEIDCYSLIPWGNRFTWYDEALTGYSEAVVLPGTPEYDDLLSPFLADLREHLRDMGWLNITTLAMDERDHEEIISISGLLERTIPEIKLKIAANSPGDKIFESVYNLSTGIAVDIDPGLTADRSDRGLVTTFYTCCSEPEHPNNFTFSPPADNRYIGWYAAANGFSGFLRWAYNSWVEEPFVDSRFRTWPSGDTYLVYPGAVSSIRFEKLREGIQDYEKILILKEELAGDPSQEAIRYEKLLEEFMVSISDYRLLEKRPSKDLISEGIDLLNDIANR